jgi:hypothetical protein
MTAVTLSFDHLHRLSDGGGLYEHALLTVARPEHGYCVDDVARALVVLAREPIDEHAALRDLMLDFVLDAQVADGRFHNRRSTERVWTDEATVEDCWGRALWGLGAVVAATDDRRALESFTRGAALRSSWTRATAFAGLGAAAVLSVHPEHVVARRCLRDAADHVGALSSTRWRWPEDRLSYANAAVPELLVAAGDVLDEPALLAEGLALLAWLLEQQVHDGHLSVVPVGGRGPQDGREPRFDQQPIEVAALADACARALDLTGDLRWAGGLALSLGWFLGDNDTGTPLHDPVSGGGCDGLERDGRNENQGAESTLALLSTLQRARVLAP